MKLSYIVPTGQYLFFQEIIGYLRGFGIKVFVNEIPTDVDLILAAILPVTHDWIGPLTQRIDQCILWHWDLYSFTDYKEPRWKNFLDLMSRSLAIWSCGHETARELKEKLGIESEVATAWVNDQEIEQYHDMPTSDYVLYAASGCAFGKRIEWAERACDITGFQFRILRNQTLPRDQYLKALARCRVYVMPAFEESNATIPAAEAACLGKKIVCSDLPGNREVLGRSSAVFYFNPNDFGGLVDSLEKAWSSNTDTRHLKQRIKSLFGLETVSLRILELIEVAYARRHR